MIKSTFHCDMDNVRKNSFSKKNSGPLILPPPIVISHQQKYTASEEETSSGEHSENEKEPIKQENPTITDDLFESEAKDKDLLSASDEDDEDDEDKCLQQPMNPVKNKTFTYEITDRLKDHFFYQPKNRYGSFFYIETTIDEDDLDDSVQEDDDVKTVLTENEGSHEPFAIEEKEFISPEPDDKELSVIDSEEEEEKEEEEEEEEKEEKEKEEESLLDDDTLMEQTENILEEAIAENDSMMQELTDEEPFHEPVSIVEDAFISEEPDSEDLLPLDLQDDTECMFDDEEPNEQDDDTLEDSMPEETPFIQYTENDESSHDPYPMDEEVFEDFLAIDSHEKESAFNDEELNEQDDVLKDEAQKEKFDDSAPSEEKDVVCETEHQLDKHHLENHHGKPKSKLSPHKAKKTPSPIVKLPVLLAAADVDLDIFDSFDLAPPISNISKIDWTVHGLKGRVLLPSTTIFLKGILVANIEYVNEHSTPSLQQIKIQVPWKQTTNIEWIYTPLMPGSSHEEYTFQCPGKEEMALHREHHEQFAEQIQFELHRIDYTWNEELVTEAGKSKLLIQGSATLSIDLLQPQYIALDSM